MTSRTPAMRPAPIMFCLPRATEAAPRWLEPVERELGAHGFAAALTRDPAAVAHEVRRRAVAAALLLPAAHREGGLALLRIIRSLDPQLPCWLVTRPVTRATLQAAYALQAAGVLADPVDPQVLTLTMLSVLSGSRHLN